MGKWFLHNKKEQQRSGSYYLSAFPAMLFFFLLNANHSCCQRSEGLFELTDTLYKTAKTSLVFRHVNVSCDTFYYTDHIAYVNELDELKEVFAKQPVIKKQFTQLHSAPDSIVLSPVELDLIRLALSRLKNHTWKKDLYPASKRISSDSVDNLLNNAENSNAILERKLCTTIYAFSPPVFFRGDKWCIFLQSQSDILTREGTCSLYYRDKDGWKRYADIVRWLN